MELARLIPELPAVQRDTLRIVTHASNIATFLSETRVVRSVHQIGGYIDPITLAAAGPPALEQLKGLHYGVFFMGVSGADPDVGWTNSNLGAVHGQAGRDEKFSQGLCDCRQFEMAVS